MLEHLFGSRTRVKLLNLFLRKPGEPIFVREITRRVGTQINAVRRELDNLRRFGLIAETAHGDPEGKKKAPGLRRKYYQANRAFPLLAEVTALLTKAQLLLERRLDQEIMKLGDVRYLAFLGAFLGTPNKAPVDLFLVGTVDKKRFQQLVQNAERDLGFEFNFSIMTPEEFKYRKDITDKFLYSILEAPKNVAVDRLHEPDERS